MQRVRRVGFGLVALCCVVWLPLGSPLGAVDLFEVGWVEDFATTKGWTAEHGWLSNSCPQAELSVADGVACFSVVTPGHGMKWQRPVRDLWIGEDRFLVIRYRAEGVLTDSDEYLLYVDDGFGPETRPFRLRDVVCDGQWHTAAVDLLEVAESDTIRAFALQVQAPAAGGARLWVDEIRLSNRLPEHCEEVRSETAVQLSERPWWADWDSAAWEAQPAWLSNPASERGVSRAGGVTTFSVAGAGVGMKWSWFFEDPVLFRRHRYVAFEYRSAGTVARSDYSVCVLGQGSPEGRSYTSVVSQGQLRHDGRWHTLTASIREAVALFPEIKGIAIQVQAGSKGNAALSVRRLGLVNAVQPESAAGLLGGETVSEWGEFEPVELGASVTTSLKEVLDAMNIHDWPGGRRLAVDGVPFELPTAEQQVCATGLRARGEIRLEVSRSCSEVFLLVLALLRGQEEQVFSRDARLSSVREVDRFRIQLDYANGSVEECFPFSATMDGFEVVHGAQVLCVGADARKPLRQLTLHDRMDRGAFVLVAATSRRAQGRLFPGASEERPALSPLVHPPPADTRAPLVEQGDEMLRAENRLLTAEFALLPLPRLFRLVNAFADDELFKRGPSGPLYAVTVDGREVPSEQFERSGCEQTAEGAVRLTYERSVRPRVRLAITVGTDATGELLLLASAENLAPRPVSIGLSGPVVGPFLLGEDVENSHYVYPMQGWAYHNRNVSLRRRYGGRFPLQFMVACNPVAGSGLYLRTEDLAGTMRDYVLRKESTGVWLSVEYPERLTPPAAKVTAARTLIGVCSGDWRAGFRAYTDWLESWYRPLAPRQQWFREVFNFRQRFLYGHDPLYDARTGTLHLGRAIDEAQQHFGGIEYLHIFDWGTCGKYGRIYGRTGDHCPYDYLKGGKAAFRSAIRSVQGAGVPVGLYIEGYLLQEKGKLGQAYGKDWQLINRRGTGVYWPNSTEMMMCPWVEAWRDVQASTYATKAAELDVDGMYLDQFGFANIGKDCWSEVHGHATPGYAVLGERGLSTLVRERIQEAKRGVVLYSEEAPCDVNSQVQDGCFTYHMRSCRQSRPWAPIHLSRFAIPSFKTFEILVCDRPIGPWSEGVKWVFFNGEGIWLEGPATEWFEPQTLAAIRTCHALLREHRDAFTSDRPVPLVQTELGGVYANLFPAERKDVYTLYNSRHRTVSGPVLAVSHRPQARYTDAWRGREAAVDRHADRDVISVTIGPRDVSCIVCSW